MLARSRALLHIATGVLTRQDYEYVRRCIVNLFVAIKPRAAHREVSVTVRRGKADFDAFACRLVQSTYTRGGRVHVVLDNLNTHFRKSFEDVLD